MGYSFIQINSNTLIFAKIAFSDVTRIIERCRCNLSSGGGILPFSSYWVIFTELRNIQGQMSFSMKKSAQLPVHSFYFILVVRVAAGLFGGQTKGSVMRLRRTDCVHLVHHHTGDCLCLIFRMDVVEPIADTVKRFNH